MERGVLQELEPQARVGGGQQGEGPAFTAPPCSPDPWGSVCWAPKLTFFLGPSVWPLKTITTLHPAMQMSVVASRHEDAPGYLPGLLCPTSDLSTGGRV